MLADLAREWRFFRHDRQAIATIFVSALLASLVVALGLTDVASQRDEMALLSETTQKELETTLMNQGDAGSAAYYGFRMAFAPPSNLAFSARGVRDELPWKHRLRILALEGQIYETDSGNPELGQTGRIDFAFVVSVLAPLLIILMLHDVLDCERRSKRLELLVATAGNMSRWALWRVLIRAILLALALLIPFVAGGVTSGAATITMLQLGLATLVYVITWGLLTLWIARRIDAAATVATTLLGIWVVFTLLIPLSGAAIAESRFPVPQGGEILLQQRETVNDAWDLPHQQTMDAFAASHPEWANHTALGEGFDWKWYYAFQQLGDEAVAELSTSLRQGVRQRDEFMQTVAWVSPPLLLERLFSRAARTDIAAFQAYENCARDYHEYLRRSQYPMLFGTEAFSIDSLLKLESIRFCEL